jgi:hypothetical protein
LQVSFRPAWLNLKRARFVARDLQVGRRLRMMPLQCKRTFVVQNGASEIACAEISVAKIVEYIRARLARSN